MLQPLWSPLFDFYVILIYICITTTYISGYEIDSGKCGVPKIRPSGRIVNGSVSVLGNWPWQVLMMQNGIAICGGTLISEEYLLTAAHCIVTGMSELSFHLGAYKRDASDTLAVEVNVHVIICHKDYKERTLEFDICIVKLNKPITFTDNIKPACLPKSGTNVENGEQMVVTGWGNTLGTGSNDYLREAKVFVIDINQCKSWYRNIGFGIPEKHFCAGHPQGLIDSCDGDSGGPLVHQETSAVGNTAYVLRGITSFGYQCALPKYPGVYIKISDFIDWMKEKENALSGSSCSPVSSSVCGGIIREPGIIRNPTTPRNYAYPNNQKCNWTIIAPDGHTISFNFICYFLLSPYGQKCEDNVSITDTAGVQTIFCGNELPKPHFVNGSHATLIFVSDRSLDYPGFVVEVKFVDPDQTHASANRSLDGSTIATDMMTSTARSPKYNTHLFFFAIIFQLFTITVHDLEKYFSP